MNIGEPCHLALGDEPVEATIRDFYDDGLVLVQVTPPGFGSCTLLVRRAALTPMHARRDDVLIAA